MDKKYFNAELVKKADIVVARYEQSRAALLEILHLIMETHGYIPLEAEEEVAAYMKIPAIQVREVMSFYTLYHSEPKGKCHIQICRTLSCSLLGADDLIQFVREKLGISPGETTADKKYSFSTVECLGACEIAPMAQIDKDYVGPLTKEKLERIMDQAKG